MSCATVNPVGVSARALVLATLVSIVVGCCCCRGRGGETFGALTDGGGGGGGSCCASIWFVCSIRNIFNASGVGVRTLSILGRSCNWNVLPIVGE